MANMQERLEAAIARTETDSILFHKVLHGTDTETVTTEGGDVSSVAKTLKDIRESIHGHTSDLVGRAETAADTATAKAEICVTKTDESAESASIASTKANNAKIWAEGTDEEVALLSGQHSAKGWAEKAQKAAIGSYPTTVSGIATTSQTQLPLNPTERLNEIEQILGVLVDNTAILPENYTLSEDGMSVILINPLSDGAKWCVKYLSALQSMIGTINSVVYEEM